MLLRGCKSADYPRGRTLGALAREIRLELEGEIGKAQADARGVPTLRVALGLQAIGLLLQLEGIDQQMRAMAEPIDSACPAAARLAIAADGAEGARERS